MDNAIPENASAGFEQCFDGSSTSQEGACNCVIEKLFVKSFGSRTFQEKQEIIKSGRPIPRLSSLCTKTKACTRYFNEKSYLDVTWLCGCEKICKLYCWPCILFSSEKNTWTKGGFSDLSNLHKAQKRHECSVNHITALIQLKHFGKTRIEFHLNQQFRLNVEKHNETVRNNRFVLSRLIDVACHLGKQELPFRGHNEKSDSLNRGNYIETVYLLSESDSKLRHHLETSTIFSGLSNHIQNDIIIAVSDNIIEEIKKEIKHTQFVSLILDETSDVSNKSQLSAILRYIAPSGDVEERFVGFFNVSSDRTAAALFVHVCKLLQEYDCGEKLIAQTYDGAAVMAGEHTGLQARVKEKFSNAIFVHCYAHKLNLVLSQSVEYIKECKIFFMNLSSFATFFSKSTKRTDALDKEVKKRFPSVAPTRWNYNNRLIETMVEYQEQLGTLFDSIIENGDQWDGETYHAALGFQNLLQDFNFNFLLKVFLFIFPCAASLFEILQKKSCDIGYCIRKIQDFRDHILEVRNKFDSLWSELQEHDNVQAKRLRVDIVGDRKACYRKLFYEVIDTLATSVKGRFADVEKMKFVELLDPSRQEMHAKTFPEEVFNSLKFLYGKHFDFPRLRSELIVSYSSSEFRKENIFELHKYIRSNELHEALPELFKLSSLILTIPATSSSAERSFSALKRIKNSLRNSQGQERLSSLSLFSIEKKLLVEMKIKEDFHNRVIDTFAKKNRRIELTYK